MREQFKRYLITGAIILLCPVISASSLAQDSSGFESKLDSLYKCRNYNELETYALRTLHQSETISTTDRAILHKFLGIVYIIQGRENDGRFEFRRWLNLDPSGHIDSFAYPPPIIRVFEEAKSLVENEPVFQSDPPAKWKPGRDQVLKSLLVPGWGQYIQGKKNKGFTFLALQSFTIAGWVVCEHNLEIENRRYHLETEPERFDELYDKANRWNYARWGFALSATAVYLLAQTDFFFLPPNVSLFGDTMNSSSDIDPNQQIPNLKSCQNILQLNLHF